MNILPLASRISSDDLKSTVRKGQRLEHGDRRNPNPRISPSAIHRHGEGIRVVPGSMRLDAHATDLASGAPGVASLARDAGPIDLRQRAQCVFDPRGNRHGLNLRRPTSRTARSTSRETTPQRSHALARTIWVQHWSFRATEPK
jgi:hypothetical protein